MKLKIDYHFHPTLSKNKFLAKRKAKLFWKEFIKNKVNVVIVTEHSYINPKHAFEYMNLTKPQNCFCFPGVECISKEGVEIIVFSYNEEIYKYEELKPFKKSYKELINFLIKNKLPSFPAHPYGPGETSIIHQMGYNFYKEATTKLKAVEVCNGSFEDINYLNNKFPLNHIFRSKKMHIEKTRILPKEDYPKNIKFLAVGSDAHDLKSIGSGFIIELNNTQTENKLPTKNEVFNIISNNKGKGEIFLKKDKFSLFRLFRVAKRILIEHFIKIDYLKKENARNHT